MLKIDFTPFPDLATERLILRQLKIEDENEIFALRTDERVREFLDRAKPESLAEVRQFIQKINDGVCNNTSVYWVINLKNVYRAIGTICLWNISEENFSAEIGYELHPDFQGTGIMQEALAKVIDFGFQTMNLAIIEARTSADNHRSTRLLQKNNFKKHLFLQDKTVKGVNIENMVIYSLVNPRQPEKP